MGPVLCGIPLVCRVSADNAFALILGDGDVDVIAAGAPGMFLALGPGPLVVGPGSGGCVWIVDEGMGEQMSRQGLSVFDAVGPFANKAVAVGGFVMIGGRGSEATGF